MNLSIDIADSAAPAIRFPFGEMPRFGTAVEVADGILWLKFPLPFPLDHVNVYAIRDPDGWTIVDTGVNSSLSRKLWSEVMAGPLGGHPVRRILLTHYHPDHIGLAGWFKSKFGAEIWSTRVTWLTARMLTLDVETSHSPESIEFYLRAGVPNDIMEARRSRRPFNFADVVHSIPVGYRRIRDGESIELGGRRWQVRTGNGHAPEHATLWCKELPLIIGGDQFLADITPNVGVYASEPEADPLSDWLVSCDRFLDVADNESLVLTGHKLPYAGLRVRLLQLIGNHESALKRLRAEVVRPRTAADCLRTLFRREVKESEYGFAIDEAVAHFNYLHQRGEVVRSLGSDGAWYYSRPSSG